MKAMKMLLSLFIMLSISGCSLMGKAVGPDKNEHWRALHLLNYNTDEALDTLAGKIPALADQGLNVLVLEVDYHFEFESHPELRMKDAISKKGARKFAEVCRTHDIRLIPQFQCLGHQSWAKTTFPLLTVYPELDLTPDAHPRQRRLILP